MTEKQLGKRAIIYGADNMEFCTYEKLPYANDSSAREQAFIDGYHECQREHEWHYVKDGDLPKDEDWKWCVSYRGYCYVAKYEEMFGCWTNQEYSEVMQPYAWKEIVLPELPKESE